MGRVRERVAVFGFAIFLLGSFVLLAFAAGYLLGKILL
jgi:hypothetical protein